MAADWQSRVRTAGSFDGTETGQDPFLNARTASDQLGLRGYVLWLAQTTTALRKQFHCFLRASILHRRLINIELYSAARPINWDRPMGGT